MAQKFVEYDEFACCNQTVWEALRDMASILLSMGTGNGVSFRVMKERLNYVDWVAVEVTKKGTETKPICFVNGEARTAQAMRDAYHSEVSVYQMREMDAHHREQFADLLGMYDAPTEDGWGWEAIYQELRVMKKNYEAKLNVANNAKSQQRRADVAQIKQLKAALKESLHVMEKGIEVRMMDQWPALKPILPKAIQHAKDALAGDDSYPDPSKAPITRPAQAEDMKSRRRRAETSYLGPVAQALVKPNELPPPPPTDVPNTITAGELRKRTESREGLDTSVNHLMSHVMDQIHAAAHDGEIAVANPLGGVCWATKPTDRMKKELWLRLSKMGYDVTHFSENVTVVSW